MELVEISDKKNTYDKINEISPRLINDLQLADISKNNLVY
jgi:hypothetical protein